jgi:hypothetical protein
LQGGCTNRFRHHSEEEDEVGHGAVLW